MAYSVSVTSLAESDLEIYADYIARDSPVKARKWLQEAWELIFSLSEFPNRFEIIQEAEDLGEPLRDVIHHSHRIVYRTNDTMQTVEVIRVWHTARQSLSIQDI